MILSILGKKVGMTQIFDETGAVVPVTVIEAGPCHVLQVRTAEKDGYNALQLGFADRKAKRTNKPLTGMFNKAGVSPKRFIREIPSDGEEHKVGDAITVDVLKDIKFVDVIGTSKGKGFQGAVKVWHFHGQPASHGAMGHRVVGSIGSSAYPSRVLKGLHMAKHMGNKRVQSRGLKVVKVIPEKNLVLVKGAVPGFDGSFVIVKKCTEYMAVRKEKAKVKAEAPK
jgi:large subunit ribosomal protein L3